MIDEAVDTQLPRLDKRVRKAKIVPQSKVTLRDVRQLNKIVNSGVVVKGRGDGTVEFVTEDDPRVAIKEKKK